MEQDIVVEVKKQNRWRSPVLWATIAAQVLAILVALDVIEIAQSESINTLVASILQTAAAFGILNNPTSSDSF